MRERDVEKRLIQEARKRGGMALKFVSPGCVGVPDRLVLLPGGRMSFMELKAPGRTPRPIQKYRMRQLEELGFDCRVIDEPGQISNALDEISLRR